MWRKKRTVDQVGLAGQSRPPNSFSVPRSWVGGFFGASSSTFCSAGHKFAVEYMLCHNQGQGSLSYVRTCSDISAVKPVPNSRAFRGTRGRAWSEYTASQDEEQRHTLWRDSTREPRVNYLSSCGVRLLTTCRWFDKCRIAHQSGQGGGWLRSCSQRRGTGRFKASPKVDDKRMLYSFQRCFLVVSMFYLPLCDNLGFV